MPSRFILLFLLFLFPMLSHSRIMGGPLSDQAQISLITCGQGEALYSVFGHTAIWVYDPGSGLNRVYNYGTFDFSQPGFYPKFLRGFLNYFLAVESWDHFEALYQYEGRAVFAQVLNLSAGEKAQMLAFLEKNLLPENRNYLYDFVRDNCTTRVRDVFNQVCGESLLFGSPEGITWRQGLAHMLRDKPWISLGINLLLGSNTDRPLNVWQEMFLPDLLMKRMDLTRRENGEPMVLQTLQILEETKVSKSSLPGAPWIFSMTLLLTGIGITRKEYKTTLDLLWFDRFLFGFTGIIGCVVGLMWFGSSHYATQNNLNILWAFPLHLVFAFLIRTGKSKWGKNYALLSLMLLIAFLLLAGFGVQKIPGAVFPWVLLLMLRSGCHWYKNCFYEAL